MAVDELVGWVVRGRDDALCRRGHLRSVRRASGAPEHLRGLLSNIGQKAELVVWTLRCSYIECMVYLVHNQYPMLAS
jgi:hypothetical protein